MPITGGPTMRKESSTNFSTLGAAVNTHTQKVNDLEAKMSSVMVRVAKLEANTNAETPEQDAEPIGMTLGWAV